MTYLDNEVALKFEELCIDTGSHTHMRVRTESDKYDYQSY